MRIGWSEILSLMKNYPFAAKMDLMELQNPRCQQRINEGGNRKELVFAETRSFPEEIAFYLSLDKQNAILSSLIAK